MSSLIVYTISVPELYLSKSVNDHFHPSSDVTVLLATSFPPANNLTVMLLGLFPSWLLASSHVLLPVIDIFSGVCVFVTLYPFTTVM